MRTKLAVLTAFAALLAACGQSDSDKIVYTDSETGVKYTYSELVDKMEEAGDTMPAGATCADLVGLAPDTDGGKSAVFPEGEALVVKACEEAGIASKP